MRGETLSWKFRNCCIARQEKSSMFLALMIVSSTGWNIAIKRLQKKNRTITGLGCSAIGSLQVSPFLISNL